MNSGSIKNDLLTNFTEDYIRGFGTLLHTRAESFYSKYDDQKVIFNETVFQQCFEDLLVDLARLKIFHEIEYINLLKLMAYAASWVLRRKPFQIIDENDSLWDINEKFAFSLLMHGCGMNSKKCYSSNSEAVKKKIDLILYHLKYRNTNPQTLELLLNGFELGCVAVEKLIEL